MRYTKDAMTRPEKPKPEPGWHTMRVRKEMPSKNHASQHCFILENEYSEIWFNCFLPDIPDFATACEVPLYDDGSADTSEFVGKYVDVFLEDKEHKGKTYRNVTDFRSSDPTKIPDDEPVLGAGLEAPDVSADMDIPF